MIEVIRPVSRATGEWSNDERFTRFRRQKFPFLGSTLELPDPNAILEEGERKASELSEADAKKKCKELYAAAAKNIEMTMRSLGEIPPDADDSDIGIQAKVNLAMSMYNMAGVKLVDAEAFLGKRLDKKV